MASACVYLECPVTKMILAVSRRDDHNAFGLPGGRVEDGEMEDQAASRELREETGLWIDRQHLVEVFRRNGGVTYAVGDKHGGKSDTGVEWMLALLNVEDVKPGEGRVAWVTPEQLMAGPFGDYNKRLLQAIGRIPFDGVEETKMNEVEKLHERMRGMRAELEAFRGVAAAYYDAIVPGALALLRDDDKGPMERRLAQTVLDNLAKVFAQHTAAAKLTK
jgi:8-oxo-dGTP pyrophosphatase MutT (NUDIX family)